MNGRLSVIRKPFSCAHKIATMYFDEPQHYLYLGFTDGEVECFVPNCIPSSSGDDNACLNGALSTEERLDQELLIVNEQID